MGRGFGSSHLVSWVGPDYFIERIISWNRAGEGGLEMYYVDRIADTHGYLGFSWQGMLNLMVSSVVWGVGPGHFIEENCCWRMGFHG